jgi:hypothetical protein
MFALGLKVCWAGPVHNNVMSHRSMNVVFQRLDFAIQKRFIGAACCPFSFYLCVIILYNIKI